MQQTSPEQASPVAVEQKETSAKEAYEPYMIYFGERSIPYKNGGTEEGQKIIDESKFASTWGGAATFKGDDNANTHFIGHQNSHFKDIQHAKDIIVTDGSGKPFVYTVKNTYTVDEYGVGMNDGVDYWNSITGTEGGERIVIQTSTGNKTEKLIIEAFPQ